MSFNIHNKISKEGITKEQFLNTEFAKGLGENERNQLGSIFDKFNTNNSGESKDKLDKVEQNAMMKFFKAIAGADKEDFEVTEKDFTDAQANTSIADTFVKDATQKDYSNFMEAYKVATEGAETEDFKAETTDNSQKVKPKFARRGRVSLPSQWSHKRLDDGVAEELKLNDTYTADEVLEKLMQKFNISGDGLQKDKLKADLIKYNPSVFDADGNVYSDAKWGNLDFPPNAGELYKEGVEPPKVQQRRTVKRTGGGQSPDKIDNLPKDEPTKRPTAVVPGKALQPPFNANEFLPANMRFPLTGAPNSEVKNYLTGETYVYAKDGHLLSIKDKSGNEVYNYFCYDQRGQLSSYDQNIYDKAGNTVVYFTKNRQGKIENSYETPMDANGNKTAEITRNGQGKITHYETYEYNGQGNRTRTVYRKADGNMTVVKNDEPDFSYSYEDYSGNRTVYRSWEGKVVAIKTVDSDYNPTFYHPDGTKWN